MSGSGLTIPVSILPGESSKEAMDKALKEFKDKQSIDKVLEERGNKYGDFEDHATITQEIKDIMRATSNWKHLRAAQKEALEMVAHKLGRILNGDPDYKDSWVDIEGYTHLISVTLKD